MESVKGEGPNNGQPGELVVSDWRLALLDHAGNLRSEVLKSGPASALSFEMTPQMLAVVEGALGPMSQEALRIIEAYTLGSVAVSDVKDGGAGKPQPPEFSARLNIILNGIEPTVFASENEPRSPAIIQSELWQLLYKVRESAEMAYARELDLVELDRRILFLLHNIGPLVPAEISTAVGVDKAQVSRSVKRMLEIKMIEREQLRSPLKLTRKGREHSERLLRLADLRNRELTFDIGDEELEKFFVVIEKLLDQAVVLYEQEREYNYTQEMRQFPRPGAAVESESRSEGCEKIVLDRSRLISPLMTLSAYFSRSGSLTFKRLTKLSNFEAWVLNEIGRDPPLAWDALVNRIDRDHSQAGRTVNALLKRGLIVREGKPGRRHGRFSPSYEGQKLFELIQDASRKRSAFLLAPLSQFERDSFLTTFDKIRRNAVVQLERERAFEELAKS